MATKSDFSADDWELVASLPWVGGILVLIADPNESGMLAELEAMEAAVAHSTVSPAAADLVQELVADMRRFDSNELVPADGDDASAREDLLGHLRSGSGVLDTTCSGDEATGVKQWVIAVAQATAEASREGGVLGFGGRRVSDVEKAAVEEIEQALGIGQT